MFHVKHRRVGKLIWRIPLGIIDSGSAAYMVLRRKLRLRELRRVIRILIGGWPERTGRSVVEVLSGGGLLVPRKLLRGMVED